MTTRADSPQSPAPPDSRASARKTEVLDAALRVIAREGVRGVTHRAVAAELGGAVRATTYYFESIDALIEAAFVHYVERALQRFTELEAVIPPGPISLSDAAQALAAVTASDLVTDRDGLIAEYSIVLETARRPALAIAYRQWQNALERWLTRYAQSMGAPDPATTARITLATLRGLEIEALARPGENVDIDDLARVYEALLEGVAAKARRLPDGPSSPG